MTKTERINLLPLTQTETEVLKMLCKSANIAGVLNDESIDETLKFVWRTTLGPAIESIEKKLANIK